MSRLLRKSPERLVFSIQMLLGAIFIVVAACFAWGSYRFYQSAQPVDAVITGFTRPDDETRAVATYTVDGKTYSTPLSYYQSSMRQGDRITVYLQPGDPYGARVKEYLFPTIFGGIGLFFFLFGLVFLLARSRRQARRGRLREDGRRVLAQVTEITQNTSFAVNNRHPFRVFCTYQGTNGQALTFRSENLWELPPNLQPGDYVPVYYDPDHPKFCSVEVDREKTGYELDR